jgi:hypothetical protein
MAGITVTGVDSFVSAIEEATNQSEGAYRVSSNVNYSVFQEYGTRFQSGTPHVRPGVDATTQQMARIAVSANSLDDFLSRTADVLEGEIKSRAPVDTGNLRSSYTKSKIG